MRRVKVSLGVAVATGISIVSLAGLVNPQPVSATGGPSTRASTAAVTHGAFTHCFARSPRPGVKYRPGCLGHDEPDIAPISTAANTARDITWTVVLPSDGTDGTLLSDVAPVFWFGASVLDHNSEFGQAFEELQFYSDTTLIQCRGNGDFVVHRVPNSFAMCTPIWASDADSGFSYAAFNAAVTVRGTSTPLTVQAGDTVIVHMFAGKQKGTPLNTVVTDVTTGKVSNTVVAIGPHDGVLSPLKSANTSANSLPWASEKEPPLSFSWEIGHPSFFRYPDADLCLPGMFNCYSYNVTNGWEKLQPVQIKQVRFANNVRPSSWSVVDSVGGAVQDSEYCGTYDAAGSNGTCTYPWYSYNATDNAIEFGGNRAGQTEDYGGPTQFQQEPACPNPHFSDKIYCPTILRPTPPLP